MFEDFDEWTEENPDIAGALYLLVGFSLIGIFFGGFFLLTHHH